MYRVAKMKHALNLRLTRSEQMQYLKDLYLQKETHSVPWIYGTITVKILTYGLSNTVNYSYAVRKYGELIESNTSTNPDKVIERIEYFTNLEEVV